MRTSIAWRTWKRRQLIQFVSKRRSLTDAALIVNMSRPIMHTFSRACAPQGLCQHAVFDFAASSVASVCTQ